MSTGPTINARMPGADLQSMVSVYLANREELADPHSRSCSKILTSS
jgi:hypothetical protein